MMVKIMKEEHIAAVEYLLNTLQEKGISPKKYTCENHLNVDLLLEDLELHNVLESSEIKELHRSLHKKTRTA